MGQAAYVESTSGYPRGVGPFSVAGPWEVRE